MINYAALLFNSFLANLKFSRTVFRTSLGCPLHAVKKHLMSMCFIFVYLIHTGFGIVCAGENYRNSDYFCSITALVFPVNTRHF